MFNKEGEFLDNKIDPFGVEHDRDKVDDADESIPEHG